MKHSKKAFTQHILSLCTLFLLISCSENAEKNDPTPLQPTDSVEWILDKTVSDEFEANEIDSTKWYNYNPTWLGREPSLFKKENVRVENGMLILTGRRDSTVNAPKGYHTFSSAAVQSKKSVLYGFFEIKCRPMNSALSSAFWLYTQDSIKQEEIDIFEICGRNDLTPAYKNKYFATTHYLIKPNNIHIHDHVEHISETPWAEKTIVAGLKWTRNEIVWYVDGKEIRRRKNDFWHSPESINFDSEAFPSWWGLPSDNDNGGEFQIEYFRYWREKESKDYNNIFPNNMK